MEFPEPWRNVFITYETIIRSGYYGEIKTKTIVTRRGFWGHFETLNGYYNSNNEWIPGEFISVPPSWQEFNGVLLPHGWGGDRVSLHKIIKWRYAE